MAPGVARLPSRSTERGRLLCGVRPSRQSTYLQGAEQVNKLTSTFLEYTLTTIYIVQKLFPPTILAEEVLETVQQVDGDVIAIKNKGETVRYDRKDQEVFLDFDLAKEALVNLQMNRLDQLKSEQLSLESKIEEHQQLTKEQIDERFHIGVAAPVPPKDPDPRDAGGVIPNPRWDTGGRD
jgi:hypothetical protein